MPCSMSCSRAEAGHQHHRELRLEPLDLPERLRRRRGPASSRRSARARSAVASRARGRAPRRAPRRPRTPRARGSRRAWRASLLVVHHEHRFGPCTDGRLLRCHASWTECTSGAAARGNLMVNVVPAPSALSTAIAAVQADDPRGDGEPEARPLQLVLKSGSKIFASVLLLDPLPIVDHLEGSPLVAHRSKPPAPPLALGRIASAAFWIRFTSTCRNWSLVRLGTGSAAEHRGLRGARARAA